MPIELVIVLAINLGVAELCCYATLMWGLFSQERGERLPSLHWRVSRVQHCLAKDTRPLLNLIPAPIDSPKTGAFWPEGGIHDFPAYCVPLCSCRRHVRVDLVARCGDCIHRGILNGVSLLTQWTQEQRDNFA